jgi:pimeloyl-ACP methyl ester carboxylesterase
MKNSFSFLVFNFLTMAVLIGSTTTLHAKVDANERAQVVSCELNLNTQNKIETPEEAATKRFAEEVDFTRIFNKTWKVPELKSILLNQDMPADWKERLKGKKPWKGKQKSYSFKRKSVKGINYVAAYDVWMPENPRNVRGTIILQHGFTRSSRYFHDMIVLLTHLGFKVITPDGANIAGSLKLSVAANSKDGNGILHQPSPLDDANAIRDIIRLEGVDKFILLGHSRGHAVTALVAAMGEFKHRILAHFAVNPYVTWLNDYYLDAFLAKSPVYQSILKAKQFQQTFFPYLDSSILDQNLKFIREFYNAAVNGNLNLMRSNLNHMANMVMPDFIAKALEHRGAHELVGLNLDVEVQAVEGISKGLAGDSFYLRGFDVLPLYSIANPFTNRLADLVSADNGFGISLPEYGIEPISPEVIANTYFVWGRNDNLVTPDIIKILLTANPGNSLPMEGASHYIPNERAFDLVNMMLKVFEKKKI